MENSNTFVIEIKKHTDKIGKKYNLHEWLEAKFVICYGDVANIIQHEISIKDLKVIHDFGKLKAKYPLPPVFKKGMEYPRPSFLFDASEEAKKIIINMVMEIYNTRNLINIPTENADVLLIDKTKEKTIFTVLVNHIEQQLSTI